MSNSILSRMVAFWRSGGLSFGGNRDLYAVFGWKRAPVFEDFVFMYRRQDIAKRIVNMPVFALWSDPPSVAGDTQFNKAWVDLLSTIPVYFNIMRLDKMLGLGRYAVMLVGFDDGQPLNTPVKAKPGRKVLYLQPYSEGSTQIVQVESNPLSPRFGLPTLYRLSPGKFEDVQPGMAGSQIRIGADIEVHYSRILHVAENTLESLVFGRPRLESLHNVLNDILKVTGGAAETFWLTGNRGLHIDVDKEMELDEDDEAALSDELKEYQHEMRRTIRTRGVKINELGTNVADPRGVFDTLMSLVAAETGIPKRILTGSEAGQLASQQDRASLAQRISERISDVGEPIFLLPFVRMMIDSGVLPAPKQFTVQWPDAFKMNPLERAQTSAQMARSAANIAKTLQTVENLNQLMARAALPQLVTAPMTDKTSSTGAPTDSNTDSEDALDAANATTTTTNTPPASADQSGGAFGQPSTQVVQTEPLMPKRPMIVLLTEEECRSIIGFGKHPPVFDESSNDVAAVGGATNGAQ